LLRIRLEVGERAPERSLIADDSDCQHGKNFALSGNSSTRIRIPMRAWARMCQSLYPGTREMDAKTIRGLVWLAALSLLCASVAWTVDHAVFASVFAALTVAAVLGAAVPRPRR
jgi:hypothetical protein